MLLISFHYSPARLWKEHNAFGTRSRIVFHLSVDGFISVIIGYIKHITRTMCDTDTRNISFGQGMHRLTDSASCFKIQSAMKVIGTYFTEVPGKSNGEIERRSKGSILCMNSGRNLHPTEQK